MAVTEFEKENGLTLRLVLVRFRFKEKIGFKQLSFTLALFEW